MLPDDDEDANPKPNELAPEDGACPCANADDDDVDCADGPELPKMDDEEVDADDEPAVF